MDQGIIYCTGAETRQIFFPGVCQSEKLKFFSSNRNEIAASVRCVSSKPVVLESER